MGGSQGQHLGLQSVSQNHSHQGQTRNRDIFLKPVPLVFSFSKNSVEKKGENKNNEREKTERGRGKEEKEKDYLLSSYHVLGAGIWDKCIISSKLHNLLVRKELPLSPETQRGCHLLTGSKKSQRASKRESGIEPQFCVVCLEQVHSA